MAVIKIVPMPGAVGDKGDEGAPGPQGPQGQTGQTGQNGQDALWSYQGPWQSNAAYAVGDLVTYQGQLYYAKAITTTGTLPTDTSKFDLIAVKGADGIIGIDGAQGEPGPQGEQGIQGVQGEQGIQGPQGEQGIQGEQGPAGEQGTSVTLKGSVANSQQLPTTGNTVGDSYINDDDGNLYVWTGSTWHDAGQIVGPQGLQGIQGIQGEQGPQGIQGVQGEQGIQGVAGTDGADALWNYLGEYNGGLIYTVGDVVTYNGQLWYRNVYTSAGYVPDVSSEYWDLLAAKGADGAQGPQGEPGSSVRLLGSFNYFGDMDVTVTNASIGDTYVVLLASPESPAGNLWTWNGIGWTNAGQILGPTGPQGEQGPQGEPGISGTTAVVSHEVKAGEALTKGQAIYISSADGTNMIVSKASNVSEETSSKTLGLISVDLANNDIGYVVTEGLLTNIDTSLAVAGDPVWLGTNGNLIYGLANKPVAPAHLVFIGVVTRSNANTGEIFVHVQNGFELSELHTVLLESNGSITDNEVLAYDTVSGLWKNQTKSEAGIPTDLNDLTDVTITGTPGNKQLLVYDTATSQWINANPIDSTGIAYKSGVPASPTSTGQVGQLAIDGANGVLYVCTSTNNWQKVSLNAANFTNAGGFI